MPPWFKRHRDNPQLKAFVDGATAAATGAITGAVVLLATPAITDAPTAMIALVSLSILLRFKVPEPIIVSISGLVGLVLWPLLQGQEANPQRNDALGVDHIQSHFRAASRTDNCGEGIADFLFQLMPAGKAASLAARTNRIARLNVLCADNPFRRE
jgi:hypothetical protein